eukprot:7508078-Pyramimonas_sp.AAC.1
MFHKFYPSDKGWRCPLCAKYVGTSKQRQIFARRQCPVKICLRERLSASGGSLEPTEAPSQPNASE